MNENEVNVLPTRPTKSPFKSKTLLGIAGLIISASAVPAIEAYQNKETRNVEGILNAVLPVLIATALPGAIAVDGRIKASKSIKF